ncbi:MAG: hypothetical protein ABI184_10270 [Ginsengibacter sp.]
MQVRIFTITKRINTHFILLIKPVTIIESLKDSTGHNSGRLAIGNVNGASYLFYTVGDTDPGQFKNLTRKNYAQTIDSLEGKVQENYSQLNIV